MAFDGIVTKAVVSELNTCLINGKINKIFEPIKTRFYWVFIWQEKIIV